VFELGRVQRRGRKRDENATEVSRTSRRRVHVVRQSEFQSAQRQEQPVDEQQRTKIEVGSVQVSARVLRFFPGRRVLVAFFFLRIAYVYTVPDLEGEGEQVWVSMPPRNLLKDDKFEFTHDKFPNRPQKIKKINGNNIMNS